MDKKTKERIEEIKRIIKKVRSDEGAMKILRELKF